MIVFRLKLAARRLLTIPLIAMAGCGTPAPEPAGSSSEYLYLWTASADDTQPDFLAVLDVTEIKTRPHHT